MKALALLPLLYIYSALAAPANDVQIVLGETAALVDTSREILVSTDENDVGVVVHDVGNVSYKDKGKTRFEMGREFVKQNGLLYEVVTHSSLPDHRLRTTRPHLCDPSVKQYSGYLDITNGKHLFFWFFESRSNPSKDPLVLWLNGGPGCSSSTGLLFELGPCRITDEGKNITHNPYSWNERANIIFLDQPIGVGFSYSTDGSTVNTSPVAGVDVYAFLELFITRYHEYAHLPFHLAAESYGGTFAPHIASVIHKKNKELSRATAPKLARINLASVMLANGLTDPYIQMKSVPEYACDGPYPIYDDPDGPQCTALRSKVPTCQRLIKSCYDFGSRLPCVSAGLYCWSQLFGPLQETGLNLYDVRRKCDRSKDADGPLCYKQVGWIEIWMNNPKNKAALGVDPSRKFESCNTEVNQAFSLRGDGMHNSAALLPELIDDGVRLLVYAGNADMMCNYIGNEEWVENLETRFHKEFKAAPSIQWVTARHGRVAGEVRTAGGGFGSGNVTFVNVYEAGHMVPYDQPEAALDLFTRWISDVSLTLD
ncbi:Alpha/Beta hydrolase protein [Russula earlei]|uniref:Alpha/Beta hydrolase protein n=1 Tax=Russula earlei TaxID=71964 RepID=A0ACC0U8J0_9AGAM|nr:Alpha/Beta hydrolase protein [Russula earlei]